MRRLVPLLFALAGTAGGQRAARTIPIAIVTEYGTIEAELDSAHAPGTVANFLKYVDGHLYDSARFHRAVRLDNQPSDSIKIEVIQAGLGRGKPGFGSIPLERTNVTGLHHGDGVLSMARGAGTDTGSSDFFIVIGDQPSLDFGGHRNKDGQGFAAFGKVTKGMDIVKRIQAQPTNGQYFGVPVTILRIVRR